MSDETRELGQHEPGPHGARGTGGPAKAHWPSRRPRTLRREKLTEPASAEEELIFRRVGEWVAGEVRASGLTKEESGRRAGVHPYTITRLEQLRTWDRRVRKPAGIDFLILAKLARAWGKSLLDLEVYLQTGRHQDEEAASLRERAEAGRLAGLFAGIRGDFLRAEILDYAERARDLDAARRTALRMGERMGERMTETDAPRVLNGPPNGAPRADPLGADPAGDEAEAETLRDIHRADALLLRAAREAMRVQAERDLRPRNDSRPR